MDFRCRSGQVVVFLAVILLAVVMLAGVLVDISRITTGGAEAKSAVRSAARSALADYSSKLKDSYGIFARTADGETLSEIVKSYAEKNLSSAGSGDGLAKAVDLYGFRVENVSVTPIFNLSENGVFKRQVLEYMKYRAPKELVEGFLDRLSAVREAGRMSAAYDKKVKADKLLGKMDKAQQRLKKNVDGSGSPGEIFINGFNSGGCFDAAFQNCNSIADKINGLKIKLEQINASINNMADTGPVDETDGGEQIERDKGDIRPDPADELEGLLKERSVVSDTILSCESELKNIRNGLRSSCDDFIRANEDALQEVNSILEKGAQAEAAINELQSFMDQNFKEPGLFSGDFSDTAGKEVANLRELILSGQKAADMLGELNSNTAVLKELISKLDNSGNTAGPSGGSSNSFAGLLPDILETAHKYNLVVYSYEKPDKGSKKDDPREGKAESAKETLMDRITGDIDLREKGISIEDLPSHAKVVSRSFDEEDAVYGSTETAAKAEDAYNAGTAEYSGDLDKVGDNVDLYDEEGDFEENALGFMGKIGDAVSGDLRKLRDDIYLNEYIMGIFKSSVPALETSSGQQKDTGFGEVGKSEKGTFYQGEIEYILHGNPSQNTNILMTKAQILLLRFGMDTLHVYTDANKREMATGIAAAVAGWWTGGAGIPIISNLVMCGWGMGEALIDLKDIMDGKPVPIFKSKGDWKLDIGLPGGGAKTDARLYFSYYDYLRLFLLVMDENRKLDRMEDLIQLDLQTEDPAFRMSGCNTCLRVEAEISVKYLFLTQPFMPEGKKGQDGRYRYRVLVYEGY